MASSDIWFINRSLVVMRPREPFAQWIRQCDPAEPVEEQEIRSSVNGYLIPDGLDASEALEWVRENSEMLFELALTDWSADEASWPTDRSGYALEEWFEIEFIDIVWDLVEERLTSDPDDPEHQVALQEE
jgi:hypothetical protein